MKLIYFTYNLLSNPNCIKIISNEAQILLDSSFFLFLYFFFLTQQQVFRESCTQNHGSIVQGYGRDCVTLARKFPRGTASSHRRKSPPLEKLPPDLREKFRFIIDLQRFLSIRTFPSPLMTPLWPLFHLWRNGVSCR